MVTSSDYYPAHTKKHSHTHTHTCFDTVVNPNFLQPWNSSWVQGTAFFLKGHISFKFFYYAWLAPKCLGQFNFSFLLHINVPFTLSLNPNYFQPWDSNECRKQSFTTVRGSPAVFIKSYLMWHGSCIVLLLQNTYLLAVTVRKTSNYIRIQSNNTEILQTRSVIKDGSNWSYYMWEWTN